MHFTFGSPYLLLLLVFLPCFLWCKPYVKTYYFPKLSWLTKESPLLSFEPWLKMFLYTFIVIALAKPFIFDTADNNQKKGRDLILAIDASGSMGQSGFDPTNRMKTKYSATLELSKAFIQERYDDNMGVVIFGTFAYTASALTYDLESLSYLLEMTNVGLAGESTAIGDAIMQSLKTLNFGEAKNQAIILLTDGYHNAGKTSPKQAVNSAKKKGIRIYTIGIGKETDYDVALLKTISSKTGAKSFSASDASELAKVYDEIQSLEPSDIRSENYLNQRLLIAIPLLLAILLLGILIIWDIRRHK